MKTGSFHFLPLRTVSMLSRIDEWMNRGLKKRGFDRRALSTAQIPSQFRLNAVTSEPVVITEQNCSPEPT